MESTADDLKLPKGMSSYSSFYKTQVSLSRGESGVKDNEKAKSENDKADTLIGKYETGINEPNIHSIENVNHSKNKAPSDMNNNSNNAEENNSSSPFGNKDNKQEFENHTFPGVDGKRKPDKLPQDHEEFDTNKTEGINGIEDAYVSNENGGHVTTYDIPTSSREVPKEEETSKTTPDANRVDKQAEDDETAKCNDKPAHISKEKEGYSQDEITSKRSSSKADTEVKVVSEAITASNIGPMEHTGSEDRTITTTSYVKRTASEDKTASNISHVERTASEDRTIPNTSPVKGIASEDQTVSNISHVKHTASENKATLDSNTHIPIIDQRKASLEKLSPRGLDTESFPNIKQISTTSIDRKTEDKYGESKDHSAEMFENFKNKREDAYETTVRAVDTAELNKTNSFATNQENPSKTSIDGTSDSSKQTRTKMTDEITINETVKQGDFKEEVILYASNMGNERTDQMPDSNSSSDDNALVKGVDNLLKENENAKVVHHMSSSNEDDRKSKSEAEISLMAEGGDDLVSQVGDHKRSKDVDQMPEPEIVKVKGMPEEMDKNDNSNKKLSISQEESNHSYIIQDIDKIMEYESIKPAEKRKSPIENGSIGTANQSENGNIRNIEGDKYYHSTSGDKSWAITLETSKDNSDKGNRDAESLQQQTGAEDTAKPESNIVTTYDNLYFTGRLPSLLSRHGTSQSISNTDHKTDGAETITEEAEHVYSQETSSMPRERNPKDTGDIKNSSATQSVDDDNIMKTPTSSMKRIDIMKEMNEPTKSVFQLSRETPLTPRSTVRRSKSATASYRTIKSDASDAIMEVQKENDPMKNEEKDDKGESAKMTAEDINIVTSKVLGTTYAEDHQSRFDNKKDDKGESAKMTVEDINIVTSKVLGTTYAEDHQSRFDNMPHMKHISDYVQDNLKPPKSREKDGDVNKDNNAMQSSKQAEESGHTDNRISKQHDTLPLQTKRLSPQYSPKRSSQIENIENHNKFEGDIQQSDQSKSQSLRQSSEQPKGKQVQRSSSENDLKAIIESAKMAISNDTETTESSYIGFETSNTSELTLQGDNIAMMRRKALSRSRASKKEVWTPNTFGDQQEALTSLICSNCLQVDSNIHTAGFCTNCQKYLCGSCITIHTVESDTTLHEIVPSYCKNELAVNKYIPATGYCADCSMFLCKRCVVQHTGFRVNRHHKIVQSSFVSKPPRDRKAEADEFLNDIQDKIEPTNSKVSSKGIRERKRKRKLLADLDNSSPYSFPFSNVPESLYPGPKKKIASSYTKNPKWVHSSIPNLPYLVQPKAIPDRVFHAAGHSRPRMIYTRPKVDFDAMAVKLNALKSRYKLKDDVKTHRRKEQVAFTARPAQARDNFSLPDINSVNSHVSKGRSLKLTEVHSTFSERKVEFINEHCLSIPIPRGEKRADILAMTVLSNGKLIVLDKNNNNIKLYNKSFHCIAALQFQNRLVDICPSNICQTDVYAATPKHIYEISVERGMVLTRKVKVDIKRIEGMVYWKYGLAIISKKTNITWELWMLDYRGNLKSKLEIFNPLTLDIGSSQLHHMTSSRGGKFISLADTRNSCIITVDVTTRVVVHETMLEEGKCPTYLTADGDGNHNLYVACDNKVFQISRKGKVLAALIDKAKENGEVGCIVYNKLNDRLYVKTGKDTISVYQIY